MILHEGQHAGAARQESAPSDREPTGLGLTPQSVEAGVARLNDLLQAGVSSAYLVEEVFRAMSASGKVRSD